MSPTFWRLKNCRNCHKIEGFPGSSMVEHSAVNRRVASSNLARGANFFCRRAVQFFEFRPRTSATVQNTLRVIRERRHRAKASFSVVDLISGPDFELAAESERVSGTASQSNVQASKAIAAKPRKDARYPKCWINTPPNVVLAAAPMPTIVASDPAAKLKRPVPCVLSLITRMETMPNTAFATPSRV